MTKDRLTVLPTHAPLSEAQQAIVDLLIALLDDARAGILTELHGIAVYEVEEDVSLLCIEAGNPDEVLAAQLACTFYDIGDNLRASRLEEDDEDGD